jgi:hypothetical protein
MTVRMKAKDFRGGLFAGGKKGPQSIEPKESSISKSIEEFLNGRKIYNDRLNAGQFERVTSYTDKAGNKKEFRRWFRGSRKGTPDRFAILAKQWDPDGKGGKVLFIEVKTSSGRLSEEQVDTHVRLRSAGALVLVARSVDQLAVFLAECARKSLESRGQIPVRDDGLNGDNPSIG